MPSKDDLASERRAQILGAAAIPIAIANDPGGFRSAGSAFLKLFGFDVEGVDYDADVDPVVPIKNLV